MSIDKAAPTSSITFTTGSGNYNAAGWGGSITGTASDVTSGVGSVAVGIQQRSRGEFWTCASFGSASLVSVTATGTTSWSLSFPAANFTADGTYVVTSTATDNAGNAQSPRSEEHTSELQSPYEPACRLLLDTDNYNASGWGRS